MSDAAAVNTDRELWRERDGDFYSPSIHVTVEGGIGIDVGGTVIVLSVYDWHRLALEDSHRPPSPYPAGHDYDKPATF